LTHLEGLEDDQDASGENFQTASISSISGKDNTSRDTAKNDTGIAFFSLLESLEPHEATGSNNRDHFSAMATSRVSPPSSTGLDTLSSFSDEETDWGEDESDISIYPIDTSISSRTQGPQGQINGERGLLRPILPPVKQAVVDRIMKKFWAIFNAETAGPK
jgi:hypothetical protein